MLHLLVHYQSSRKKIQGFTLLEMLTVLTIIGVLIAIATPSILATYTSTKLTNSLEKLVNTLELSQIQAIRTNKQCQVYIPNGNQIVSDCLLTADNTSLNITSIPNRLPLINLDDGVTMRSNIGSTLTGSPPPIITYNFRGITRNSGTIILSPTPNTSTPNTSLRKCLEIDSGVGLIRSGTYIGPDFAGTCQLVQ